MSLKMKFHKHLAGNMNHLPELFPNRVYRGQDTMVWNTHTEGIVMKGVGQWASLRIMSELWLNQRTPLRESQQWPGHHSHCHCNRKEGRSCRQLPCTAWKKALPARRSLTGEDQPGLLAPSATDLLAHASLSSPQSLAFPVPWPGVKGQPLPCHLIPCPSQAWPPPLLSLSSATSQHPPVCTIC